MERPSRCPGWTVRDVLSHLAGEELYNHACLNGDIEAFRAMVRAAGITGGYDEFNQWCVRQRRGLPASEVLAEWQEASAETRHRMTMLGRDAPLTTAASPTPRACRPSTTARSTPPTRTTWAHRWPRAKNPDAPRGGPASAGSPSPSRTPRSKHGPAARSGTGTTTRAFRIRCPGQAYRQFIVLYSKVLWHWI